jgi:hypothetical protein
VTVEVPAGETATVTFDRTFETVGEYPVAVGGADAGTVVVDSDDDENRQLSSSLGMAAAIPVVLGLFLALWRRRVDLIDALRYR